MLLAIFFAAAGDGCACSNVVEQTSRASREMFRIVRLVEEGRAGDEITDRYGIVMGSDSKDAGYGVRLQAKHNGLESDPITVFCSYLIAPAAPALRGSAPAVTTLPSTRTAAP